MLHGTGQIVSILDDPNGFDLGYAHHQKGGVTIHGSVYGHGIYLGIDDMVSHGYNKTQSEGSSGGRKFGNVLMGMMGWDSSIVLPSTVVAGQTGVYSVASPLCKVFAHSVSTHYNGIVASHNMLEEKLQLRWVNAEQAALVSVRKYAVLVPHVCQLVEYF